MLDTAPSMEGIVNGLMDEFTEQWWACDTDFPDLGPAYTPAQQRQREKDLERYLDELYAQLRRKPLNSETAEERQERFESLVVHIFMSALGLEKRHLDAVIGYGFKDAIANFAEMARTFDDQISDEDIYQAARNATSMNLMQVLLGIPMEVTPAVFAFSMLYPYTDNYLDDPAIPASAKKRFNTWFRSRIENQQTNPANQYESKISDLIELIENQYERARYPLVYDSLISIHEAQSLSIELMRGKASPYELDVLHTSLLKGGTSALADGYLVAGDLTPDQRRFMFYYGAFTQLMDDLEDVHGDREAGILTIFSQTAGRWPLDRITNKTIHFGGKVIETLDEFTAPGLEPLKEMLAIVFSPILVDSASCAARYFSRPYLNTLQAHYPFRFSFLKKQRKRFQRQQQSLKLLLEGLMMAALVPPGH